MTLLSLNIIMMFFSWLSEAYMCRGELAAREDRKDEALSLYGMSPMPQASFCQVCMMYFYPHYVFIIYCYSSILGAFVNLIIQHQS